MKHLVNALAGAALFSMSAAQPAGAQNTLKIGSVLSVTGPAAFLGEPEEKTIKMYVEKVNAEGGVNGKKLELVVYDDGGDASKARTFATRLVEDDKVIAMVGGSITGTSLAMIPVFEEAKIPFISSVVRSRSSSRCASSSTRRRIPTRWPARRSSRT